MERLKTSSDNIFTAPFTHNDELLELSESIRGQGGYYALFGLLSSAKSAFLYANLRDYNKLVIVSDEQTARQMCEEYQFFDPGANYFPAKDVLFYQSDLRSNEITIERIKAIKEIISDKSSVTFCTIEALMNKLVSMDFFTQKIITLKEQQTIDLEKLRKALVEMDYEFTSAVMRHGEFCIRGGIIDIYPSTEELPVRIELWGDEIDSIRTFDPGSQKSIGAIADVTVMPAGEMEERYSGLPKNILDYFSDNTVIVMDDLQRLCDISLSCEKEFLESMEKRELAGMDAPTPMGTLFGAQETFDALGTKRGIVFSNVIGKNPPIKCLKSFNISTNPIVNFNNSIPLLKKEIAAFKKKGYRVVLVGTSRTRQKRLCDGLCEDGINCYYSEDYEQDLQKGQVLVTYGRMDRSVDFADSAYVFITDNDIFGEKAKKRKKTFHKGEAISAFYELTPGDYVIHENYGLGIYQGLEKIEQDKIIKDYIKISYDKGANLYVQVSQLDLISKYSMQGERKPKLNSLGNPEWSKTKTRIKTEVNETAKELVELYASRQQEKGFVYGEDTVWQKEFEETFPYEETAGQADAIDDVKSDMMSEKIMDRLICGDVGYGKTEIALRAAFKAVQENKQVVYLCPTTILCQQHYKTFVSRMKNYPIEIGMLSRFKTNSENKKTIEGAKNGSVDIIIGTHRALSNDVSYKDLGLLVIDEEQRFGVSHKEKIKQLKKNVDVISLTATPIPRTLHMSLVGIRDMSILEEAPLERQPVQTYVFEYNEEMVREAISRELARGGQVYYVINRVRQIADIAARIQTLVPEAEVVYAHGKMPENKLEEIMTDFVEQKIDVLVATTIIEIGLDISNVNTIIIHDADKLGLSQLYQLRGRVGRSSRRAYAFLMYKKDKILTEVAHKRLSAINEFTELGSGFKIAMRDLEIRGAGNVLGKKQHGHMEAVGYDLYCKLLSTAVKLQKGESIERPDFETSIELKIDGYIPLEYIPDEEQKLEIYKKISFVEDETAKAEIVDELIDRFGEPPMEVIELIDVAMLKNLSKECYVTKIRQLEDRISIKFYPQANLNPAGIPGVIEGIGRQIKFYPDKNAPEFIYDMRNNKKTGDVLDVCFAILKAIRENMVD